MASGFEMTSMTLTSGQTHSVPDLRSSRHRSHRPFAWLSQASGGGLRALVAVPKKL